LRIAARLRFDQHAQIIEQARIRLAQRLATAARPADPLRSGRVARTQFGQSTSDRAARDARGTHHRADPAMTRRSRLGRRKTPPPAFVKYWSKRLKALAYRRFVNHTKTI
jgi:hypothetical protein